jgi:hypothetical protein
VGSPSGFRAALRCPYAGAPFRAGERRFGGVLRLVYVRSMKTIDSAGPRAALALLDNTRAALTAPRARFVAGLDWSASI